MKCFEFYYDIRWGSGCGVIFAESEDNAIKMMMKNVKNKSVKEVYPLLKFTEIDITKPQIIDHSWEE